MYLHGWHNYLKHGYPLDDLAPLSCAGKMTLGTKYLTLIDASDGLAILGELKEFRKAIDLISQIPNFDIDAKVSVFETTIRILGGLLSSHALAKKHFSDYNNRLLNLAVDLADRLIPAFYTPTGINYGNINLRYGASNSESSVTCTACAALAVEFGYLSQLTGNWTYYNLTKWSMQYIWEKRSSLNLLGAFIDVNSGEWIRKISGIGSELDSYYEYAWKSYLLFNDEDFLVMFQDSYKAVETHLRCGERHIMVDMNTARPIDASFQALQSFWSGLQVGFGDVRKALQTMRLMKQITLKYKFIPEKVFLTPYSTTHANYYILRPELIESIYFLNSAMKDPWLQEFGFEMLQRLYNHTIVPCGFAGIKSVISLEKIDHMESFFLSETLKYMYLLFDDDHEINSQPYVFTTEAHPFPLLLQTKNIPPAGLMSFNRQNLKASSYVCNATEFEKVKLNLPFALSSHLFSQITSNEEILNLTSCLKF
ncbi:hypothetical protein HMI54_003161 [Coelomomyces lativittatus]|nr:hypothetical protein HMI54_003161 [Coelomomyces lativittatus]